MPMIPQKKETAAPASAPTASKPAITPKAAPTPGPAAAAPAETAAPAPAPTSAPAAAPAAGSLATRAPNAGAVAVLSRPADVIKDSFKDAFTVDWNTLHRIQANNGNFLDVEENKKVIGTELLLELMSYQDNWQISPGTDDESDTQYVRYSNDGKFTTEGEDINEYLQSLREANYTDASCKQRVVLAGTIVGGAYDGKLVQLNLSTTSKQQFDRFRMQASIDVSKGKRTVEDLRTLKMRCTVETKGKNSWTKVLFDYAS